MWVSGRHYSNERTRECRLSKSEEIQSSQWQMLRFHGSISCLESDHIRVKSTSLTRRLGKLGLASVGPRSCWSLKTLNKKSCQKHFPNSIMGKRLRQAVGVSLTRGSLGGDWVYAAATSRSEAYVGRQSGSLEGARSDADTSKVGGQLAFRFHSWTNSYEPCTMKIVAGVGFFSQQKINLFFPFPLVIFLFF